MKYPPVPLVTELTLPIFFCLSLPYVLILIIVVIWLRLLLNEGKEWILPGELLRDSLINGEADKNSFLKEQDVHFHLFTLYLFLLYHCS
uniref:Uncharacterized protein n=1 Tax=Phasianus colchicus TaxID=9054 RepID=A0A669PZ99_PHACC